MSHAFEIDPHTKAMQARASEPTHSAWVSANAGSGKTFVLSRRVVRLLLAGVEPSRILCLTYTKAAAGEMSNRVFEILGKWAVMTDAQLREELLSVEGKTPTVIQMNQARILFARALETPGGLKIQTIHAFCEALLHQFPLEANVPGKFSVMDDGQQQRLIEEARKRVIVDADAHPGSPLGQSFISMMEVATDGEIERALKNIVEQREELAEWLEQIGGPEGVGKQARHQFAYSANDTVAGLCEQAVKQSIFAIDDLRQMSNIGQSSPAAYDRNLAARIESFFLAKSPDDQLAELAKIFLTSTGGIRTYKGFAGKEVKAHFPDLEAMLEVEAPRLIKAQRRVKTFCQIVETERLMVVAEQVINQYRNDKRNRGLLDFDDLINRTGDLLTRKDARAWVLYKLDLGIDHILLDEAQDTSPQQWQIIGALVDEFFSGESAKVNRRTVFAVGDEKQSIYSFRGAEPRNFSVQRRHFLRQANAANMEFADVGLGLSFRSTSDVLGAVDTVFALEDNARGLTFDAAPPPHTAARKNDPGSVEVWDLLEGDDGEVPENWHVPVDVSTQHQALQLADKIAQQLNNWIGTEPLHAKSRPIGASDILVLVRSRDRFVGALNRALKEYDIPVAGADRLAITDHIAVQDLMALGQVMLTPDDDLSLATVLKSPLLGLNEQDLLDLTLSRFNETDIQTGKSSLHEAMSKSTLPHIAQAFETIALWRNLVDQMPVYEFYARILSVYDGRKNMLSRLGSEAEDVIDAFLNAALDLESKDTPGLQAFLNDLTNEQPEIKREMDRTAGEVRIMTVHAAKGLEAPIVFLVDKCGPAFQAQHAPALYQWQDSDTDNGYLWARSSSQQGDVTLKLREEEQRKAEEEHRRLLYVGMTRAEDRLIICGYRGKNNPPKPNWHAMVSEALEPGWRDVFDNEGHLLWHQWNAEDTRAASLTLAPQGADDQPHRPQALPDWMFHQLPTERALPKPLSPSRAQAFIDEVLVQDLKVKSLLDRQEQNEGTGETDSTQDPVDPRIQGTALHKLLQVLPQFDPSERRIKAESYLVRQLPQVTDSRRSDLIDGVLNVLDDPRLKGCFDLETSGAEIPIMGKIDLSSGPRSISGTIDRLAVKKDGVYLIDFKTSTNVPQSNADLPPDYVTQMALYRELVRPLYAGKPVYCWLIWTHAPLGPVIMDLSANDLDHAMNKIAQL